MRIPSMHLDEDQVQRLLHDELSPQTDTAVRHHLVDCDDCRELVTRAKDEEQIVYAMLGHLDRPAPVISVRSIAARARTPNSPRLRVAAGLLLAIGLAGAAYALPGSPLRRWVDAVVTRVANPPGRSISASSPAATPQGARTDVAGIAVAPGASLVISFTSVQAGGYVDVALTEGAEVIVRAPMGAATYTSDAEQLVIQNSGSSSAFEIQIPRSARRVEIRVGSQQIFLKEGLSVRTGQSADSRGRYRLALGPTS
jgi:hypothetical protein